MKVKLILGIFLMTVLFGQVVLAQEWATEELFFFEEQIVITAAKRAQNVNESPSSVFVINRDDIKKHGYRYLSDALRYIPGVDVHWAGGPQYVELIELRGLDSFLLLIDGVRANPSSGVDVHFGYAYPLNHVERIEVMMGPSSALYGADAAAGIINIITMNPEQETKHRYEVDLFGGNHEVLGSQILLQQKIKDLDVSLSMAGYHQDDDDREWWDYLTDLYDDPSHYPEHLSEHYQTEYANPMTSFSFASKVQTENSTVGFNYWTREVDGGLRLDPKKFAVTEYQNTSNDELLIYIENKFSLSDKLNLTSQLSYHYYITRYNFYYTPYKYESPLDDPRFDDSKHYRESGDRIHLIEELSYQLKDNILILMGLEGQALGTVPKAYDSTIDSTGNEIFGPPISDDEALTYYHIRNGGGFLQVETSHYDDRLKLNVGTRADYFSTFGWTINPRASLYGKIHSTLSARLMYGRAYLTPSPALMFRTTYVPGQRYQTTNKGLDPEIFQNYEMVLNWNPHRRITLETRVFRTDVTDKINFIDTGRPYSLDPSVNIFQYQNTDGTARYEGIEALARVAFPHHVESYLNFAYLDGYTKADDGAPKVDLNLFSQIKMTGGLTFTYQENYLADIQVLGLMERKVRDGNSLYPDGKMDDVVIVNLYLRADNIWRHAGLNLKIDNLLDEEWSDITTTSGSASPELPQERFRIVAGVNWGF